MFIKLGFLRRKPVTKFWAIISSYNFVFKVFPVGKKVFCLVSDKKIKVLSEKKKRLTEVHYFCFFLVIYRVKTNFNLDKQFSLYNFDIFVCNEAQWR